MKGPPRRRGRPPLYVEHRTSQGWPSPERILRRRSRAHCHPRSWLASSTLLTSKWSIPMSNRDPEATYNGPTQSDRLPMVQEWARQNAPHRRAGHRPRLRRQQRTMRARVQPALRAIVSQPDGTDAPMDRAPIYDVPVVWPGGGGFVFHCNLIAGDTVWLMCSERGIASSSARSSWPTRRRWSCFSSGTPWRTRIAPRRSCRPRARPRATSDDVTPTGSGVRSRASRGPCCSRPTARSTSRCAVTRIRRSQGRAGRHRAGFRPVRGHHRGHRCDGDRDRDGEGAERGAPIRPTLARSRGLPLVGRDRAWPIRWRGRGRRTCTPPWSTGNRVSGSAA